MHSPCQADGIPAGPTAASPRIWYDVSTLFRCPGNATGIPRVVSRVLEELLKRDHVRVRLCWFDPRGECFVKVTPRPSRLQRSVAQLGRVSGLAFLLAAGRRLVSGAIDLAKRRLAEPTNLSAAPAGPTGGSPARSLPGLPAAALRKLARKVHLLCAGIHNPSHPAIVDHPLLYPLCLLIGNSLRLVRDRVQRSRWPGFLFPLLGDLWACRRNLPIGDGLLVRCTSTKLTFTPNDLVIDLGAAWVGAATSARLPIIKQRQGFQYVSMIYDFIPDIFPHMVLPRFTQVFQAATRHQLAASDLVMLCSASTRKDLNEFVDKHQLQLPPTYMLQLGSDVRSGPAAVARRPGLGIEPPFVLSVSTVDVRKNHRMLYYVWRRLAACFGDAAPRLVIAGKPGYLTSNLLAEIEHDPLVRGRILLCFDADDRQLDWLYRHCLFTVYPSIYEGWGLPIAESLRNGKYCISSTTSSMPEAGGPFVDYADPYDFNALYRLVCRAIFDEDYRRQREGRIRQDYQPPSWAECVRSLMGRIDSTLLQDHCTLRLADLEAGRKRAA